MSAICLIISAILDISGRDGSVYRYGAVFFAVFDLLVVGIVFGGGK